MDKKLVLPGDHLSSAEEAEAGENAYLEGDDVYSAAIGEPAVEPGSAAVRRSGRTLKQPHVGMLVYGLVFKSSPNKAVASCIPAEEAEGGARGVEIDAVLPVTAVRSGFVRDLRDEVKIGDIIKARIHKVERSGFEITIRDHDCGVICAFCPRCRGDMALEERIYVCVKCGWKERKKLPLKEGEAPPPEREGGYRREGGFRREGRGFGRDRRGGRGPPRGRPGGSYGRRPSGGGRRGQYY